MTAKTEITLEALSGIKNLSLEVTDGQVSSVSVNMGKAILECVKIPMRWDSEFFINQPVMMPGGETLMGTAVSMGNPHIVFFTDDVDFDDFEMYGRFTERNELFPEKVNTEFVKRISETEITMRVWERGTGETLACGTGACASGVACVINGFCEYDTEVRVNLKGGVIFVTYYADGTVIMRGEAATVFSGEIDI
jgi:diaminopimelate epimerase